MSHANRQSTIQSRIGELSTWDSLQSLAPVLFFAETLLFTIIHSLGSMVRQLPLAGHLYP